MLLLGTGPTEIVRGRGKNRRTNTCGLISHNDTNILIGLTKFFEEQIEESGLKPEELTAVLLSHSHNDQTDGTAALRRWLKDSEYDFKEEPIPIYCEEESWDRLKEDFKQTSHLDPHFIEPYDSFEIGDIEIIPFRVDHSRNPEDYPTVGFRFGDKLTWNEDTTGIPDKSEKYFNDIEAVVLDAAMWFEEQIFNHFNVKESLDFMKDKEVDRLYLIQAGRTYPQYDEAMGKINRYWKKIDGKAEVLLTYDGLEVEELSQALTEKTTMGLNLIPKRAKAIYNGEKDLIIREEKFKDKIGKTVYLTDAEKVYGTIRLQEPEMIDLEKFSELKDKHKITEEERKRIWENKKILYAYDFNFESFDNPRKIERLREISTFTDNIQFLDSVENIEDMEDYDPSELSNRVLSDDIRIAISWYATQKEDEDFKYSEQTIVDLATQIWKEIVERKKHKNMKYLAIPKQGTDAYQELWEKADLTDEERKWLTEKEAAINKENLAPELDFLEDIKEGKLFNNYVCLIGSTAENQKKGSDLDILIRDVKRPQEDPFRRAVEQRIIKSFPEDVREDLHIIWESAGPHSNFIPLYNLELKRKDWSDMKVIEFKEIDYPYKPMKPSGPNYDIGKLLKKLEKRGWFK